MFRCSALLCAIALVATPLVPLTAEDTTPDSTTQSARPFLGVYTNENGDGLVVTRVIPGTSAAGAGVLVGDIITAWDATVIRTQDDLRGVIQNATVGDAVTVSVSRSNVVVGINMVLQARPDPAQQVAEIRSLGTRIRDLEREKRDLERAYGVLEGGEDPSVDTGTALMTLAATLEALPEQLEQASRDFKAIYPEGEFRISIDISITSDATADQMIDVSPGNPTPTAPPQP